MIENTNTSFHRVQSITVTEENNVLGAGGYTTAVVAKTESGNCHEVFFFHDKRVTIAREDISDEGLFSALEDLMESTGTEISHLIDALADIVQSYAANWEDEKTMADAHMATFGALKSAQRHAEYSESLFDESYG